MAWSSLVELPIKSCSAGAHATSLASLKNISLICVNSSVGLTSFKDGVLRCKPFNKTSYNSVYLHQPLSILFGSPGECLSLCILLLGRKLFTGNGTGVLRGEESPCMFYYLLSLPSALASYALIYVAICKRKEYREGYCLLLYNIGRLTRY